MKIDLSKTIKKDPVEPEEKPEKKKEVWKPILLSIGLVAATAGLTFGLVKFTGVNAMEAPKVDSYEAIKDEHIALLEMEPDEFYNTINDGDSGIAVNLPKEKKAKSKKEMQEEIDSLKQELEDVIADATKTEKELKDQLESSTSDVSESRKEIKAEYEEAIRIYEDTEQKLREENERLANHVEEQQGKIAEDEQIIQSQNQTIQELKDALRAVEAREQELMNRTNETEVIENEVEEPNREH